MVRLRESQKQLIEKLGVAHERNGFPPAEGRIMSLLFVSDETELSFDDIQETLGISKSAVSNGLNSLLRHGKIEYITRSGDRKRYFRVSLQDFPKQMKERLNGLFEINQIFKEAYAQRSPDSPEFNAKMQQIIEFMDFLQVELPGLIDKWKQRKQNGK